MSEATQNFYRIQKLPPYVFAVINEMKAKARAAGMDVVDLGMGNPDGTTPQVVVDKHHLRRRAIRAITATRSRAAYSTYARRSSNATNASTTSISIRIRKPL